MATANFIAGVLIAAALGFDFDPYMTDLRYAFAIFCAFDIIKLLQRF